MKKIKIFSLPRTVRIQLGWKQNRGTIESNKGEEKLHHIYRPRFRSTPVGIASTRRTFYRRFPLSCSELLPPFQKKTSHPKNLKTD